MRVISGVARGTNLVCLDGLHTRPTTDRIKEAIFNMIQNDILGSNFLDIFSGSGAIGIEAISRGAVATFIENSKEACQIIKKNLEKTKLLKSATLINKEALLALDELNCEFDIIFLDPPYQNEYLGDILNKIASLRLLKKDGIIIVEQLSSKSPLLLEKLNIFKVKEFKMTKIVFYCWGE